MQADTHDHLKIDIDDELQGQLKEMVANPVPFNQNRMQSALEDPRIKQVRVFKLKPGMAVDIGGTIYKVIAVRPNGKITMRRTK